MPSPTWLRGSAIANAAECVSSVVALAIGFDCVGVVVGFVDVEFNTSGDDPDIIRFRFQKIQLTLVIGGFNSPFYSAILNLKIVVSKSPEYSLNIKHSHVTTHSH